MLKQSRSDIKAVQKAFHAFAGMGQRMVQMYITR